MRKLSAALAVAVVAAVGASAANATNFPIYQCPYHAMSGDKTFYGSLFNPPNPPVDTVYIGSGTPFPASGLTLHFGWAAQKSSQVKQFLTFQFSNGASLYDTTQDPATLVWSYQPWPMGGDSFWSAITSTTVTGPSGKPVPAYVSNHNTAFPTLIAGHTYVFSIDLELKSGVNDGFNAVAPGPWLQITNCSITVN
jgi:opacity protein-like surface antigen